MNIEYKKWESDDGSVYLLTDDEIDYLERNGKIGNIVAIPRTGFTLDGEDLTLKYHGVKNPIPFPKEKLQ